MLVAHDQLDYQLNSAAQEHDAKAWYRSTALAEEEWWLETSSGASEGDGGPLL